MKTNFFEHIGNLHVAGNFKIGIHTDDKGSLTVSVLFTADSAGDKATNAIIPIIYKGTAQELDEGFFEALSKPVQATAGLYTNLEAYLKSVEQAKINSKQEQDKKAKAINSKATAPKKDGENPGDDEGEQPEASLPKVDKEQKKREYDNAMQQVTAMNEACRYAEALAILPSVLDYPEKTAEINKRKAELERNQKLRDSLKDTLFA
jgi:PRTRC genetic system protein E